MLIDIQILNVFFEVHAGLLFQDLVLKAIAELLEEILPGPKVWRGGVEDDVHLCLCPLPSCSILHVQKYDDDLVFVGGDFLCRDP